MKGLNKKHSFSGFQIFAMLIAASFLTVVFQAVFQNGINPMGYLSYLYSPSILILNFIPVFILYLVFFCITNSLRASVLLTNIPITVFLLINEFKILYRDEPFKATDITLVTETANMLESYVLELSLKIILTTLLMIAMLVFSFKALRSKKVKLIKRIAGIVLATAAFLGMYLGVYSNYDIYTETDILGNEYRESEVFANKGFIYSFISSFSGVKYEMPEGYSKEAVADILKSYIPDENEKLPNVIAIMSEAFFDPQIAENLEFLPGKNPLYEFNRLKEESMSGNIFVPGFAGGTAQTEYEFLSGSNITLIDPSMPTIYKTHIKSSAYNLASAFKSKNFHTVAIHPGHNWFYNRQNVYKSMEFDEMTFFENLPKGVEMVNYYTSDKVTSDLIIESYKKHLEENPDKGYFNFTVTIQNHGPYKESEPETKRIVRPEGLTDVQYNILEHYLNNLYDASMLLCDVAEFAESLTEPTVIVFFGDHLPYLDQEYNVYETIGYSLKGDGAEGYIKQHSTPFVIWGNSAFKKTADHKIPKDGGLISSNFLAARFLEYIDADLSPYFMFLKDLSNSVTVISNDINISNGKYEEKISGSLSDKLNDYRILQYYNLNEYKKPDM